MSDLKDRITEEDIALHAKKRGAQNTGRLLSVLGKDKQFINAWDSPIGKELMEHDLNKAEMLLEKIIMETASEQEKADFRAVRESLVYMASRITRYYKNLDNLKRGK